MVDNIIASKTVEEDHLLRTFIVGRVVRYPNRSVETNTVAVNAEDVSVDFKMVRKAHEREFDKEVFCALGTGTGTGYSFEHNTELKVLKLRKISEWFR